MTAKELFNKMPMEMRQRSISIDPTPANENDLRNLGKELSNQIAAARLIAHPENFSEAQELRRILANGEFISRVCGRDRFDFKAEEGVRVFFAKRPWDFTISGSLADWLT
jgi:hypothetical protein